MRALLSTSGTRGDVQPFVALASALQRRGHTVVLCAPEGFRTFIERHGVTHAHMDNGLLELTQAILNEPSRQQQRQLFKGFGPAIRRALDDEWHAAKSLRPDVLVYHSKALGAHHIAEKLGVSEFLAMPLPLTPTRAFAVPLLPALPLGGAINKLTYRLVALGNALWAGATNDFRVRTLGLRALPRFADSTRSRVSGLPVPSLYAFSEHVLARPTDWPDHAHVTGCWFVDEAADWHPPPALSEFLEAGPAPVYIGFGSMGGAGAVERAVTVCKAVGLAGQRAVLASGWGGLKAVSCSENVCVLPDAPHDWLFPKMCAVVHHGGAGSTMAGLRAGKPSVICPFIGDQPFWGRTLYRAGLGAKPIAQNALTPERLAQAIRDALAPAVVARAQAVGARIRAENGAECAAMLIERGARWAR